MHSLLQLAAASQHSYHPSPGRAFRSLILVAVLLIVGVSLGSGSAPRHRLSGRRVASQTTTCSRTRVSQNSRQPSEPPKPGAFSAV